MMKSVVVLLALALLVPTSRTNADPLEAGLSRVDITPQSMLPMYGYEERHSKPAEGTHDRLYAKALVLSSGKNRIAIVTMDLGSFHSATLRRRVADELGIPLLLLASSHTHSGPVFIRTLDDKPDISSAQVAYRQELERKLFDAVRDASAALFPAKLGMGRGSLQLGYNRLVLGEDGRAHANYDNYEHVAYGPVDPQFLVLSVEDLSGATRAVVVHYACHAVVLQQTNFKYSADYPGVLQASVEAALKGAQCMFVQGGAGDINPLMMGQTGKDEEDFKAVEKMGTLLAQQVLRTVREIKTTTPKHPGIQTKAEVLTFPDRWEKGKTIEVGIATVLINDEIAIATVPGEPMHRLQTLWKSQQDVPWPLFYGYTISVTESWPGYIPDVRSAAYGGYGADFNTKLVPGAGEEIMLRHLINVYDLRGMWRDKPGKE
jgi:hypothetical protein